MSAKRPASRSASRSASPPPPAVPADCAGDRMPCLWRTKSAVRVDLACGQRCQLGAERPGSTAWYRSLCQLAADHAAAGTAATYLIGVSPHAAAAEAFVRRGLSLDAEFVRHVLTAEPGQRLDERLSSGARRDARRAQRNGLRASHGASTQQCDAFFALYRAQCVRLGIAPQPRSFIDQERAAAGQGFQVFSVHTADQADSEPLAAALVTSGDGWTRIVELARAEQTAKPDAAALLVVEVAREASQGRSAVLDFGITPAAQVSLRQFKSRLGFPELADVCALTPTADRPIAPPERPPLAEAREDIALLERCNFACGFCYREPWVPELDAADVRARLREIAAQPGVGVAFSGGEPTLRADLADFIAYARRIGIADVQLHSNGWRAAQPGYAQTLANAGLGSAMISLHSHRAESFASITRTSADHLGRTLLGIDNLRRAGVYVLLSLVINALNFDHLPEYVEFVSRRLPGAEVFVFFVYPSVKGQGHPELYPRLSEVRPRWHEALRRAGALGVLVTVDSLAGLPLCQMGEFRSSSRYAYAAEQETRTQGAVDDHLVKVPEMRQGAPCQRCSVRSSCPGFWSDYLDRFGDEDLLPW